MITGFNYNPALQTILTEIDKQRRAVTRSQIVEQLTERVYATEDVDDSQLVRLQELATAGDECESYLKSGAACERGAVLSGLAGIDAAFTALSAKVRSEIANATKERERISAAV